MLNQCYPVTSSLSFESLLWWSRESYAGSSSRWAASGPGCLAAGSPPSSHESCVLAILQAGIPGCTSLTGHQGWHSTLHHPRLVSGRTHGGAGKRESVLIAQVLPSGSALQGSLTAQRTPHSPFAASPGFLFPSLLVWLNPRCLTPQPSCEGVLGLTAQGCEQGVPQPHGSSASGGFCCQVARQHFNIYLHA